MKHQYEQALRDTAGLRLYGKGVTLSSDFKVYE